MDKKQSSRKREKRVRVNMTLCKYEVVRKIVRDRGWQMVTDEEDKAGLTSCNVHWIDVPDFQGTFKMLQPYAKVNHFPGMTNLARKSKLARNFDRMKKLFPEEYDFCPKTWILPFDFNDFQQHFNADGVSQKTFIVKPDHMCQGRGVFLTRNLSQINRQDILVAQQYVRNPLLIEGKKFDLRIYVLVSCCDPLCVYLFKDGLVRMCTADYVAPNAENMEHRFMHLTNYAVNKHSNNFELNKKATEDGSGSKRSLRWFFSWLKESYSAEKTDSLWEGIGDICLKAILAVQPTLAQEYRSTFAKNLRKVSSASSAGPSSYDVKTGRPASAQETSSSDSGSPSSSSFSILGMDVLVDEHLKPWLLEVNHLPSFGCDSPLDWNIKERLISQTFDIVKISAEEKEKYEVEMAKSTQVRLYGATASSSISENNNLESQGDSEQENTASKSEEPEEDDSRPSKSSQFQSLSLDDLRQALSGYYTRFNPERLKDLDKILIKYGDNQEVLNQSLVQKYGKDIHEFAPRRATSTVPTPVDNSENLVDFILMYPPPRQELLTSKYRKMLEASQQHMNEQQMRFSAPLQHRRVEESLMPNSASSLLPPIKGAMKKNAADQMGRDCFGFIGTDKAKWLMAMEREKKPLAAPSADQLAVAHRMMLGHSSQKHSIKPPTPPEQMPKTRKESVNYGIQYRERLASIKQKPTVQMTQISFGSFD
ncbi:hypothetical protein Poli38472_000786 [Pythium oligandrum]|uniref:Uncharacterized protein n=1 Tax=Pythium oligandrum TaxID=41045 RepID=A0A8K1CC99_PYTOL|nr:hypothetical protein Poli38472_000786 [Pythium oligandrum]|eukprot:TMW60744.1 hypothetical protein Poli38472_000786 [Pythium oligandrum]